MGNVTLSEECSVPSGSLILGSAAELIRPVPPEEIERIRNSAKIYVERARAFKESSHSAGN